MLRITLYLLITIGLTSVSAQAKKPLDHDAYDIWNVISEKAISPDGQWVFLSLGPEEHDRELRIKGLNNTAEYRVERGESAAFSAGSRYVVTKIKALKDSTRMGKREKLKPEKMPKDSLGIITLESGDVERIGRVQSFKMPRDHGGWLAYLMEKVEEREKKEEEKKEEEEKGREKGEEQEKEKEEKKKKKGEKKKVEGTDLVLRNLVTGEKTIFSDVVSYDFSRIGNWLVFTTANKDSTADAIRAVHTTTGDSVTVLSGPGEYKGAVVDSAGTQLAFVTNRDSFAARQPHFDLYHWDTKSRKLRVAATEGMSGIPTGWWVSEHGSLEFSEDGGRLFFGTAPRPEPDPEEEPPEDEQVVLDVWHWKDPYLQPMQLKNLKDEQKRSYRAVIHLKQGKIVQLATEAIPDVRLGSRGNADIALGTSSLPYRQLISWDSPRYTDAYLIDVTTGQSSRFATQIQHRPNLSPESRYAYWWDYSEGVWRVWDVKKREGRVVSDGIPYPVHNEDHDQPSHARSYGLGGWTDDDRRLLVNDRHDVWLVDPTNKKKPVSLTAGAGRADSLRFRRIRVDRERAAIDPKDPVLFTAFDYKTKSAGFYRAERLSSASPERLLFEDRHFTNPTKAKHAERYLLTRSRFDEFPDLCVTDPDFSSVKKVSDANPQQKEYLWGSSELVEWTSLDGDRLQGILYKPEGFDPARTYPTLVYFYERLSRILHWYTPPRPSRSVIVPSFYTSRGYVVFVPDIRYKPGYPGESAVNAIVPGVTHLIDQGFVDAKRIGVQGHSWGGYQIAYLITRSNLFAAAEAGAIVSNMTSAYGGIRWGSGLSRMMQYEKSQSRIGASLWESPLRYVENSPIFWADKIETPLLMMHNDKDGSVPWYQGIEMFVALRRLGKPVWMLNYNGEDHGLKKPQNKKDFSIRMQQFFDHFLMGEPAPVWLAEGIPAVEKGKTLGLEAVEKE